MTTIMTDISLMARVDSYLKAMKKQFPSNYDFYPKTFSYPNDELKIKRVLDNRNKLIFKELKRKSFKKKFICDSWDKFISKTKYNLDLEEEDYSQNNVGGYDKK